MKKVKQIFNILGICFLVMICYTNVVGMGKAETVPAQEAEIAEDTRTKALEQIRAEVFQEMGWQEGVYANEKEKEYAEKIKKHCYGSLIQGDKVIDIYVMAAEKKELKNIIRPMIEFIFDTECLEEGRVAAINNLGYIGDSSAIPVLKKIINDEDSRVRAVAIRSLYYCGDKKTALEIMVKLNKEGIPFWIVPEKEFKNYYSEILKINNHLIDINKIDIARYFLEWGDRNKAKEIFNNIKENYRNGIYTNKFKKKIESMLIYLYEKLYGKKVKSINEMIGG